MTIESDVKEAVDRMRRIETRLTAYLVKHGEQVGGYTPVWDAKEECVVVHSADCPLSRCMNVIPPDMSGDVYIRTEDFKYIATIHIGGER